MGIIASATLMLLCSLDVLSPFSLYLNWQLIIYELQLWRLVTCFLFFGTFGLPFFWNTYVLVFYCSSLEDVAFHSKSADFLWMLLCSAGKPPKLCAQWVTVSMMEGRFK